MELFQAPFAVVVLHEGGHGLALVLQGLKDPASDHLLLEGLEKPLSDAIGLGLADKAEALADTYSFNSWPKWSEVYWQPWSLRTAKPAAMPAATLP